jgi:hypothetical protein
MNRTKRHGVVLLAALLIVPLIAVAVAAIGSAMSAEARRGLHQNSQAQLEQLLLAATQAAQQQLAGGTLPQQMEITTPPSLAGKGAQVLIEVASQSRQNAELRVAARVDRISATQTITFARTGSDWVLTAARLEMH